MIKLRLIVLKRLRITQLVNFKVRTRSCLTLRLMILNTVPYPIAHYGPAIEKL